jgi:hypothetical protein
MTKKKTNKKKSGDKAGKKRVRQSPARSGKDKNPVEVREEISRIVRTGAAGMTQAVMGEGLKGHVAPVKFLFEVASIYPTPPKGEEATEEEDCLAKILLAKISAPPKPVEEAPKDIDEGEESEKTPGPEESGQ